MLPAAQCTESSHVGAIMDGKVAAVALAEHGAFGMGRPQLAALRDGLAVGTGQSPVRSLQRCRAALRVRGGMKTCLNRRLATRGGRFGRVDARAVREGSPIERRVTAPVARAIRAARRRTFA